MKSSWAPEVDPDLTALMSSVLADRRGSAGTLDRDLWEKLASLGLARLTDDTERGGSGAAWPEAAALLETAAWHGVPLPVAEHDLLAGWVLRRAGLENDGRLRTLAVADASGDAEAVPWLGDAEAVVVLREQDGQVRVADVPVSEVQVRAGRNLALEPRDRLELARPDEPAVASLPADVLEQVRLRGALARAVQMCGAMDRLVQLVLSHVADREQFGRALSRFQAVQHLVADMAGEAALARAAAEAAVLEAWAVDTGQGAWDSLSLAVAAARSCAGHAATVVVRNGHQVLGAMGTTQEHDLHHFSAPVLAWRSEYGSTRSFDETLTGWALTAGGAGVWGLVAGGAGATADFLAGTEPR
jgi:acyl-CoA dehydrogenase